MESIYRDAYPDVFATFDDFEFFAMEMPSEEIENSDKEDSQDVEVFSE